MHVVDGTVLFEFGLNQLENFVYTLDVDVVFSVDVLMTISTYLFAALRTNRLLHRVAAVADRVEVAARTPVNAEVLA